MSDYKRKLAIFSHHRSGTHFLMNSIAMNTDYIYRPYWLLDFNLGVDIWATPKLYKYLKQFENLPNKNIMKSHFFVEFIEEFMEYFSNEFHVFYIMRKHCDTLMSYYRYSKLRKWLEAPDVQSVSDFIRAEPAGSCLRWQRKQYNTMLKRWEANVAGWIAASKSYSIHVIRYEDLLDDFENTVSEILNILDVKKHILKKPGLSGIEPWCGGNHEDMFTKIDIDYIRNNIDAIIWDIWDK